MRIDVTQEHIDTGIPQSTWACPISIAMREAGCKQVSVSPFGLEWDDEIGGRQNAMPSIAIAQFIYFYDVGDTVEPFSFHIRKDTNGWKAGW